MARSYVCESFFHPSGENRQRKIDQLVIIHQNSQSIGNSIDRLEQMVGSHECQLLIISEHWKSIDQLEAYKIYGFTLRSHFCRGENRRGGVAIYCRDDIKTSYRSDINELSEENYFECAAVEISFGGVKLVVVGIYRVPEGVYVTDFMNKLHQLLILLMKNNDRFIIGGDFNINCKDRLSNATSRFISLLQSFNVNIAIDAYTRVTATTKSCIDNFLTNISCDYNASVIDHSISDHFGQKIVVKFPSVGEREMCSRRVFSSSAVQSFVSSLLDVDWREVYSVGACSIDEQYNAFSRIFTYWFELFFRLRR